MKVRDLYEFAEKNNLLEAEMYFPSFMEDDNTMYEKVDHAIGRLDTSDGSATVQLRGKEK